MNDILTSDSVAIRPGLNPPRPLDWSMIATAADGVWRSLMLQVTQTAETRSCHTGPRCGKATAMRCVAGISCSSRDTQRTHHHPCTAVLLHQGRNNQKLILEGVFAPSLPFFYFSPFLPFLLSSPASKLPIKSSWI